MKIAFFEIEEWEEERIKKIFSKDTLFFSKEILNKDNIDRIKDFDVVSVFIYSNLNKELLSCMKELKMISTRSTGFNHIDLKECKKRNIKVCNVPFYGENTVAEHAFALILTLSRKIHDSIERTKKNDFSVDGLMGFDLRGKTIGVIGVGHIGQHVIRMAKAFEMNVVAFSEKRDAKLERKLRFRYVSLDQLLSKSDIITLHVPLNKETKHMINMKNAKKIKEGAYLINTARGELIDTKALIYALDKGIVAGAGLDVLEGECDIKEEKEILHGNKKSCDMKVFLENHLLLMERNVVVTPHSAFYSKEAIERILDATIQNIDGFKKGKMINFVK